MGKTRLEAAPVALYGCILLMSAVAYYLLGRILIRDNGPDCALPMLSAGTRRASCRS